jgi:UDP-N-acetylmuramoyl-tripeptide--D-alanyl-D-alanine ligase
MQIEALYQVFLKCSKVFTDSRQTVPGGLFFALRGDQFDGNQYAAAALVQGASHAVVDDPAAVRDERYILVENTLTCLQKLARFHRRQFTIPVIAITGSNGKTTTKELIQSVLGAHYRVHATRGNLNNHIGAPLTLLAMPKDIEVAVIEMGANHQREIDALCRIVEPTHGLITNIGKAHLEGFGGIEGVKKGKGELYDYLAETNGAAFINKDEPFLEDLARNVRKKIFYVQEEHPDPKHPYFEVKLLAAQPRIKVAFLSENGRLIEAQSHLIGIYNFNNIKTAVTLGKYFKVPGVKIKAAVESYIPENNRSQIIRRRSNTFILDAYNANPSSMQEAVRAFGELNEKRKIAILGDMLELGDYSEEGHELIARLAVDQELDRLILVGPLFQAAAEKFGALHFPDTASLKDWFAQQNFEDTFFLIKGSRKIGLERLLED